VRVSSQGKRIPDGITPVTGDLTDPYSLAQAVKLARPDVVFHLAALTPVSESFNQPLTYMDVNYGGTVRLAETCRRYLENLELFIYASSTETVGWHRWHEGSITEKTPCRPNTPYAISKYAAEQYLLNYMYRAYNFPAVVVKPTNTYGRAPVRQTHFVVEKILVAMLRGEPELRLGNPDPVRDFMFREDHVDAYLSILETHEKGKTLAGETYCFGTGVGVTIKQLVETAAKLLDWNGRVLWRTGHYRPADCPHIVVSAEKAKQELNWEPRYDLHNGLLKAALEWKKVLGL